MIRHDTEPHNGGHRYRLLDGSAVLLTSGTFQLQQDADACGKHFAADEAALRDFLKR